MGEHILPSDHPPFSGASVKTQRVARSETLCQAEDTTPAPQLDEHPVGPTQSKAQGCLWGRVFKPSAP